MWTPELLRTLDLDPASHPRGQPWLSAGSGLERVGRHLYVVADDEHHLACLDLDAAGPLSLLRMVAGSLPDEPAERKRRKPDFEAITAVPAHAGHPHGALLVFGSGSRPNRQHALRLPLDAQGHPAGAVDAREFGAVLEPLQEQFTQLNIEGAFVQGERLALLQRGRKGDTRNACILLSLAELLAWMDGHNAALPQPLSIVDVPLGVARGVPFGLTDGCALPQGGWLFSAVAEDTSDAYRDGDCVASAIGCVDAQGELRWMEPLAGAPKVEGLALDGPRLLMVTDPDDPQQASRLLQCPLPRGT